MRLLVLDRFWLTWSVEVAIAVGTIGAVLVALFGQAFRARFFPPQLKLGLVSTEGEAVVGRNTSGRTLKMRYYHLRVSNDRRWSPAHGVRIVLLQVEELGPDGMNQVRWTGDVPFAWRHQQLFPVERTIGAPSDLDLISVSEEPILTIHLLLEPLNLQVRRHTQTTFVLKCQARGNESDSDPLAIKVAWDGNWHEDMSGHLALD